MHKDERDLIEVLKFELNFLEKGGYGSSPREPWRPKFIFEDSPTCMNYDCKENPAPCSDCVLMQLVPLEFRFGKIPCRQIQLNASGETLENLYRYADQHEIEETFGNWLRATIRQSEDRERVPATRENQHLPGGDAVVEGTALHQTLNSKCANPSCPITFHWLQGGRFFRFRPDGSAKQADNGKTDLRGNVHGVRHFWLCEHCCHVFTLVSTKESGVILKLLWPEHPLWML
jgi:hypothetical protein